MKQENLTKFNFIQPRLFKNKITPSSELARAVNLIQI